MFVKLARESNVGTISEEIRWIGIFSAAMNLSGTIGGTVRSTAVDVYGRLAIARANAPEITSPAKAPLIGNHLRCKRGLPTYDIENDIGSSHLHLTVKKGIDYALLDMEQRD